MVFRRPPPPPPGLAQVPPPPPPLPPPPLPQAPWVLVLPRPNITALSTLSHENKMVSADGAEVFTHQPLPFVEAFGTDHASDAHLTLYGIETVDSGLLTTPYPRISKDALETLDHLREQDPAGLGRIKRIVGSVLALDFDLPGHATWTDFFRTSTQDFLATSSRSWPILATPTVFYATRGGFRLVWALNRPVDVQGKGGLEDMIGGLIATAYISGLIPDHICKDWTRLYRLPRVMREDKSKNRIPTWTQPYYAQSWGRIDFQAKEAMPPDGQALLHPPESFRCLSSMSLQEFKYNPNAEKLSRIDWWANHIGKIPAEYSGIGGRVDVGDCPDDAQVQMAITGGGTQSAGWKNAINQIRLMAYNKDPKRCVGEAVAVYKILQEGADIRDLGDGHMHISIGKLARSICQCLKSRLGSGTSEISAQFIHSMVLQPARLGNAKHQQEGKRHRGDAELTSEVWKWVSWHYQHVLRSKLKQQQDQTELEEAKAVFQQENLKQFKMHEEVLINTMVDWSKTKDPVIIDYIKRNWSKLLVVSYGQDRYVLKVGNSGDVMYSDTPTANWANVLTVGRDCGHSFIDWYKVTEKGTRPADEKEILPVYGTVVKECRLSRLVPRNRVYFTLDGKDVVPIMVEALPGMRTDIVPKYNPLIDEWLTYLGGSRPEVLLSWLSAFPLIEKPLAALYIKGESGIGKGMLADALANMTQSRQRTPFDQAFQRFQHGMFKTPFLHCDERMLEKKPEKHVLDTFKQLISGEFDSLERKGIDQRKVEGNWRVLITANHDDAIPWETELNKGDKSALLSRLLYITADSEKAREFLKRMGQWKGTAGWAENEIPQHLAWLVKEREHLINDTERFLVESLPTEYHENIYTMTSVTCSVITLIGRMLREINRYPDTLFLYKGELCVNPSKLDTDLHNMRRVQNREDMVLPKSLKLLGKTLRNISIDKESKDLKHKGQHVRVWRLDIRQIIDWLDKNGDDVDFREQLGKEVWEANAPDRVRQLYVDTPVTVSTSLPSTPPEKFIPFSRSAMRAE